MKRKKLLPVPLLILIDVLAIAACLCVYALFHHVLVGNISSVQMSAGGPAVGTKSVIPTAAPTAVPTAAPTQQPPSEETEAPELTPEPTAEPIDYGQFGEKFQDKFAAEGELIRTDTLYVSHDVRLELQERREYNSDVHIMDIYVRNMENFRTTFAGGADVYDGTRSTVPDMAAREHALAAINGDYCGFIWGGEYLVLRNGVFFYSNPTRAVCVLYYDGSMRTFWKPFNQVSDDFDLEQAMADGAWQIWSFGPALLDDEGQPNTLYFDPARPRTMLGYYEPGHYAFITVDGRTQTNAGVTLDELAELAASLGLTQAFNLDGGQSSTMVFGDRLVSIGSPNEGLREISDMIYITETDGSAVSFGEGTEEATP